MRSIWSRAPLQCALVMVLAAGLHLGALWDGFVFDDHQILEANPLVTQPGHLGEILTSHYWHPVRPLGYLYRPLTVMSFRLDWLVGGGRPVVFHATSILMHAGVSAMVFLVLGSIYRQTAGVPLLGALLFAAHPVHVEAVAGIAGRADLMATFFVMLAWWLHLRSRSGLAAIAFFTALLCKESAVVAPALLIVSDLCLGALPSHPSHSSRPPATMLRRYGPSLVALAVYLTLRTWVLGAPGGGSPALIPMMDNPLVAAGFAQRLATALKVLAIQTRLLCFPWKLSADYSFDQIPIVADAADPLFLAGLAILTLAAAAAWRWRARRNGPALPVLSCLVCLVPISNVVVPIGTMLAERTLYLPSFGFCAGVALALGAAAARLPRPARGIRAMGTRGTMGSMYTMYIMGAIIIALLGARTVTRVADWRDDLSLFETAARSSPESAKAHYNLGMLRMKAGDDAGAASSLQRAVEIARGLPERLDMMRDLATALSLMGRKDEALALLERARYINPAHPGILVNLGNAYAARGERDKAMEAYEAALRVAPEHSGARMNRARLLLLSGRAAEAVVELERVTREAPRLPEAFLLLGDAYLATGRRDAAAGALQEAIRLAPSGRDDIVRAARERLSRLK